MPYLPRWQHSRQCPCYQSTCDPRASALRHSRFPHDLAGAGKWVGPVISKTCQQGTFLKPCIEQVLAAISAQLQRHKHPPKNRPTHGGPASLCLSPPAMRLACGSRLPQSALPRQTPEGGPGPRKRQLLSRPCCRPAAPAPNAAGSWQHRRRPTRCQAPPPAAAANRWPCSRLNGGSMGPGQHTPLSASSAVVPFLPNYPTSPDTRAHPPTCQPAPPGEFWVPFAVPKQMRGATGAQLVAASRVHC